MDSEQEWEQIAAELRLEGAAGHLHGTIGGRTVRVQQEAGRDGPQLWFVVTFQHQIGLDRFSARRVSSRYQEKRKRRRRRSHSDITLWDKDHGYVWHFEASSAEELDQAHAIGVCELVFVQPARSLLV